MALRVDKRVKSGVPVSCCMRDFAVPVFTLVHEGTGMGANGSIIRGTEVGFNIRTGRSCGGVSDLAPLTEDPAQVPIRTDALQRCSNDARQPVN